MLEEHRGYLGDGTRMRAFRRAIARKVGPGDVVLDLGAGTGILGLLALRAGAARVHAVDAGPVLEIARATLREAGFADRWTGIRGHSTEVDLPERADIVVADHVGGFGLDYGILGAFADARKRHLRRGGRFLPETVEVHVALVSSAALRERVGFWTGAARRIAANTVTFAHPPRRALVSRGGKAVEVDLRTARDGTFEGNVLLRASRGAAVHGLLGYFRSRLAPGVWMTNSPFSRDPIQRSPVLLPLEEPLRVRRGERVPVRLRLRPAEGLVTWTVAGAVQSTFLGRPLAAGDLRRLDPDHRPRLTPRGRAKARVLHLCGRGWNVGEIRRDLRRRFPALFAEGDRVSAFVDSVLDGIAR